MCLPLFIFVSDANVYCCFLLMDNKSLYAVFYDSYIFSAWNISLRKFWIRSIALQSIQWFRFVFYNSYKIIFGFYVLVVLRHLFIWEDQKGVLRSCSLLIWKNFYLGTCWPISYWEQKFKFRFALFMVSSLTWPARGKIASSSRKHVIRSLSNFLSWKDALVKLWRYPSAVWIWEICEAFFLKNCQCIYQVLIPYLFIQCIV